MCDDRSERRSRPLQALEQFARGDEVRQRGAQEETSLSLGYRVARSYGGFCTVDGLTSFGSARDALQGRWKHEGMAQPGVDSWKTINLLRRAAVVQRRNLNDRLRK
jgi:hypothetical protein